MSEESEPKEVLVGFLQICERRVRAYMADDETYWRIIYEHGVRDDRKPHLVSDDRYVLGMGGQAYGHAKRGFIAACEDALLGIGSSEFHMAPWLEGMPS